MQTLWKTLLSRLAFSDAIIGADEALQWSRAQWHRMEQLGLLRETSPATALRCQECEEQCSQDVAYTDDGRRAYLSCPRGFIINLAPEQVRRWLVDPDALARLLAVALRLTGPVEQRGTSVWSLGRRVLAGRFRDFLLSIGDSHEEAIQLSAGYAVPVVLVPVDERSARENGPPVFSLRDVSSLEDGRIVLEIEYIEDSLPTVSGAAKTKKVRAIPVPEDATWQDVRIEVGELGLRIAVRGEWHERSLEECGLSNGRKQHEVGDLGSYLLWTFARHRGHFDPRELVETIKKKTPFKNKVSQLRGRLRAILPIDGEPILYEDATGEYRCAFGVSLESDRGFSPPEGITWSDFEFRELSGGRLRVGVRAKEAFRASTRTSGADRAATEVAEREAVLHREYALEQLGLANNQGFPNAEGQALIELLRGGGKLRRSTGDLAVMRLGARLREWIGLTEDPLEFSEGRRVWVTYFGCGSSVR